MSGSSSAAVLEAIGTLNCDLLLDILPDSSQQPRMTPEMRRVVFFHAVDSLVQNGAGGVQGARIIYLLRNLGAQINMQNQEGDTPLMLYLRCGRPDYDIVEAFLRCNADVYLGNKLGEFPLEIVTSSSTPALRDLFLRYVPGIWEAVSNDDAMSVRRLINEWCRVDVQKNGKTLLQMALEMGTESIIRIVSGIRPSMEFAHCVLAGDTQMVKRMLRLKLKINVNFRNLGDRGKPPVYYALSQENLDMIHILLDRGTRLDLALKGDDEMDIPMYFYALEHTPPLSAQVLKDVMPVAPIRVDALFYKGRNILFHCIEKDVGEHIVDFVLSKSSAFLVSQRVQQNKCAREMAVLHECTWMVKAIDAAVVRWMYHEEGLNRQILVLQGYQYVPPAIKHVEETEPQDTFYKYLGIYQQQVLQLHLAVEECDEETVRHILYFRHPDDHSLDPCLADSRRPGDGQPLLHKAVLRGSVPVTQLLCETLVYQRKQRLDSIRDQYFRTALHYTYGMENGKELVNLLLDYGASEFTMDKDNRSPLAFKDRSGQHLMEELLLYHYQQDFTEPEPDPWIYPMPIPMVNYLCSHSPRGYLSRASIDHLASFRASLPSTDLMAHHAALPSTELAVTESSRTTSPLAKAHKYKSVSDTKLHKLTPAKPGLADKLAAHFPGAAKSKPAKRTHGKYSVDYVRKDYLPLPLDAPRDSEDDYDFEDGADSRDLLDEKDLKKSTSCCVQ